jgi:sugar lactone lactonase YvrE
LPDGRLLVTGPELLRREPDGSMVRHADLSDVAPLGCSEIVVDGRGNVYVNSINFDFLNGQDPGPAPGLVTLITPDGSARLVADSIAFPNGMVITPDNSTLIVSESFTGRLLAFDIEPDGSLSNRRVWAEGLGPDGITMDAEGAVWTSSGDNDCVRVRQGGEILDRIQLDRACFACMLGGPDGRTLFMLAAKWLGPDKVDEALALRSGQIRVADAPAPRVGWP